MTYRYNGKKISQEEWDMLPNRLNDLSNVSFHVTKNFEYESPLSGKIITSRQQRSDEMKRYGVREVEPSEVKARKERVGNERHRNNR